MEQKYMNSKNTNNEIVIKKSRFLTHIKRTVSEEEAKDFIDESKHLIIHSPHPSPLSSYRGFFSSRPFSRANEYLKLKGEEEVDFRLTSQETLF